MIESIKLVLIKAKSSLFEFDKQQHFLVSFGLYFIFLPILGFLWALALTALIGFIKEIWDHYRGSGFCWWDMLANFFGIFVGFLSSVVIPYLLY